MIKDNKVYEFKAIKKDPKVVYGTKVYPNGKTGSKLTLTLSLFQTAKRLIINFFKPIEVQDEKDAND